MNESPHRRNTSTISFRASDCCLRSLCPHQRVSLQIVTPKRLPSDVRRGTWRAGGSGAGLPCTHILCVIGYHDNITSNCLFYPKLYTSISNLLPFARKGVGLLILIRHLCRKCGLHWRALAPPEASLEVHATG